MHEAPCRDARSRTGLVNNDVHIEGRSQNSGESSSEDAQARTPLVGPLSRPRQIESSSVDAKDRTPLVASISKDARSRPEVGTHKLERHWLDPPPAPPDRVFKCGRQRSHAIGRRGKVLHEPFLERVSIRSATKKTLRSVNV